MDLFKNENLTQEEAFWVMYYFLEKNYELSGGTFDISDILSASTPVKISGTDSQFPADLGMADFWKEAHEKFKLNGIPQLLKLTK